MQRALNGKTTVKQKAKLESDYEQSAVINAVVFAQGQTSRPVRSESQTDVV